MTTPLARDGMPLEWGWQRAVRAVLHDTTWTEMAQNRAYWRALVETVKAVLDLINEE
jgi:hypothetical protein